MVAVELQGGDNAPVYDEDVAMIAQSKKRIASEANRFSHPLTAVWTKRLILGGLGGSH